MTLPPTTITDALNQVVRARSDVVAVQDEETALTYGELDLVTNHVADELAERTAPGAPIAVMAEHRVHAAVAMLAATKAGRISVVLDPREPPARLTHLAHLAGCELLVASDPVSGLDVPQVHPDILDGRRAESPDVHLTPDDVAAVYFTSGTTGSPKGVTFTHANVALRAQHRVQRAGFKSDDVYGVLVNLAFGYSTALYVSLLAGLTARLLDVPALGVAGICARFRTEPITIFGCVPIVLRAITDAVTAGGDPIETIRMLETGGEGLQAAEAVAFFEAFPRAEIRHLYGSAESGTIAQQTIHPHDATTLDAMRAWDVLPWQRVELVDESGDPAAEGESGEVVVAGPSVALGYWRDDALTNEWFSSASDGTRRVRTGDYARSIHDGQLVFEGRRDDLVKVSGQRVDLAIVMGAINELSEVDDSVTFADESGHLVAYVVPAGNLRLTARELRAALAEKLPEYMMPREYFLLEEMPRTQRGKFDRARLQAIRAEAAEQRAPYVAPSSDTERQVAREFEAMLGVDNVGIDDNFYELGGDSLAVLELLESIREAFSIDLHDSLVLESMVHSDATVRGLTRAIDAAKGGVGSGTNADGATTPALLLPDGVAVLRIGTHDAGPADDSTARLFLVPGAGEGTVRFVPLANELRRSAVYSFQRRGYQTRERPDGTIEQLAARLVSALRAVQPTGPYAIGGYSFGCMVAYEMAQQLHDHDEHAALLVLLDPLQPASTPPRRWNRLQRARSRVMRFALGKPSASYVARARQLADQAWELAAAYQPRPYDGHVLVIKARGARDADQGPEWDPPLSGTVERAWVDGSHLKVLGPDNAAALAATIDAVVERLDGGAVPSGGGGSRDVGEPDDGRLGPNGRG